MRGHQKIAACGLVLVALAIVVAALFGGVGANSAKNTNNGTASSSQPSQTAQPNDDVKKQFTLTGHGQLPTASQYVRKGVLNKQGIAQPQLGFTKSVALGQRYRPDSPSSAPQGASNAAKLKDVGAKIYQDPIVGYTYGNMLCRMKLGDWSVGAHNPWLKAAGACQDTSKTLVHRALPYWWSKSTPSREQAATKAWKQYEAYASRVVTLLNNLHMVGAVQHPVSTQNWHLLGSGMVAGDRFPLAGLNTDQENLPALVLAVVNKGQSCEQARVGINLKDSRPEVFVPQGCQVPHTTPPGKGGCTSNCTTPPPGCTHNCTTTHHGCTVNCGKGGCKTNCTTPGCTHNCTTPPPGCTHNCGNNQPKCTPVALPDNRYEYTDSTHCYIKKKPQSFDQQQNGSPADQGVQDNKTSGANTGPTKGAPSQPSSSQHGSGTSNGTAPNGSSSDGQTNDTNNPNGSTDDSNSGDNNGTTGSGDDGGQSTGGGTVTNPFG